MAKRLSRIERDIERLKEKISEYQQQLKELEAAKTEQENLQIIQLVLGPAHDAPGIYRLCPGWRVAGTPGPAAGF